MEYSSHPSDLKIEIPSMISLELYDAKSNSVYSIGFTSKNIIGVQSNYGTSNTTVVHVIGHL